MMNNMRALLRVQMLNAWRGLRDGFGGGKSKWGLLLLPLALAGFAPLMFAIGAMYLSVYFGGAAIGRGELTLTIAFTVGQIACLTFGVFYVISAFYFSKDISLLIPMPLRPGEIVLSKFISIMIGEYLTMLPIVGPALVIYGIFAQVSWTFIPFALVVYLLLPVVPLVLSSLFSIVLMRVTNLRRNRDLYRVMGGLLGLATGLGFNYLTRLGARNGHFDPNSGQIQQVIAQQQAMLDRTFRYFPTSTWMADALQAGAPALGAIPFLVFVGVALVAMVAMVWVAEKLFYGGAVGGDETRASGRKLTREELTKETSRARAPLWALLLREIKLLNRTPSFVMQALVPIIIMPVFIVMPLIQEREFGAFFSNIAAHAGSPLVPAVAVGAVLFMASMSAVPATAISREGKHFWVSRSLPVQPRAQIHAKLLHSLIFSAINVAMALGGLAFFKLLTPLNFVYVLVGGLLASAAMGYAGLIVDLLRPNLKWTDPQQAMKGNYNVLFGMLFIWLTIAILAGLAVLLYRFAQPLIMPALIAIFAIEAFLLGKAAGAIADRRYVQIED
ncbi:MAG TPA: hypothetical protein VD969_16535 [Symbiobacteriaceae bacterium]|nr:hypothetical protein [Symbiobacteriaceae bacterium]